jgi:hypothetical protein
MRENEVAGRCPQQLQLRRHCELLCEFVDSEQAPLGKVREGSGQELHGSPIKPSVTQRLNPRSTWAP